MAGNGVSFAEAIVTAPDGTTYGTMDDGVQVTTKGGALRIRTQEGAVLVEIPGVAGSVRNSRKRWTIRMAEGEPWSVLRTRCNCGGA